jgi:hypothetical protein
MTPAEALFFPPRLISSPIGGAQLVCLRTPRTQSPAPILQNLGLLWKNENFEDYVFKPTTHSYRTAKSYIKALYPSDKDFPEPAIDPDGNGGIELQWNHGRKILILGCRPNRGQKDFIYYQDGQHGMMEASPLNLNERLTWLTS